MATIFRLFAIYLFVISSSVVNALPFNEGRTVVAAFPKNFPPEYQMTPEGVPYGFAIEVMDEVMDEVSRRAGLNIQSLSQENWEAVWDLVIAGEVDLVPNMGVTPHRAEAMLFTEPYDSFNIRIFTNKSEQYITNLSDLKGKRVSTTPTNVANTLAEAGQDHECLLNN